MPKDTLEPADFWSALGDVTAGMLMIGDAPFIPMSHQTDRDAGALWFITAQGTAIVDQLRDGPRPAQYIVAEARARLYARIDGTARLIHDRSKLDDLWSPIAGAWFDGKDDPDLRLVRLDLGTAEAWHTDGAARFFYEIARANVTGDEPGMGTHGVLTF